MGRWGFAVKLYDEQAWMEISLDESGEDKASAPMGKVGVVISNHGFESFFHPLDEWLLIFDNIILPINFELSDIQLPYYFRHQYMRSANPEQSGLLCRLTGRIMQESLSRSESLILGNDFFDYMYDIRSAYGRLPYPRSSFLIIDELSSEALERVRRHVTDTIREQEGLILSNTVPLTFESVMCSILSADDQGAIHKESAE